MSPEAQAQFLARLDEYEYRIETMAANARAFISRPNFTTHPVDIWWPPHPSEAPRTDWSRIIAGCAGVAISSALLGVLMISLKL
jgi:hypothetical protein